jgi:replicative DNA helicase
MDLEHYFVSAVIGSRDIQQVLDARITPDYLMDDDHRRVFEFVMKHFKQYGETPLISIVRRNFPTYSVIKVDHQLSYYCDEVRMAHMQDELTLVLADMQEALEERKPKAALSLLQQAVGGLVEIDTVMVDENAVATWEKRLEEYEELRENKGRLRGYPTGFPSIDRATQGLQEAQFNLFVGPPKSGKSTILLVAGKNAHRAGAKVLLINFEMTNQEVGSRYDSIVAQIDHQRLLTGNITRDDIKTLERVGKEREGMREFIFSMDVASATTVSGIAAKIDQYKPDVVLIDGIYLMEDENGEPKGSSQALTNITRDLAKLCKTKSVNITGTTQVLLSKISHSRGITAASVGYSSSFAQDCHVMIAVDDVPDVDNVQSLKVLLSRSGPKVECEINWDWSTGTFEELDYDDEEEAA